MIRSIYIIYDDLNVLFSTLKVYFDLVLSFDSSILLPSILISYGDDSSWVTIGFHMSVHVVLHFVYNFFYILNSFINFLKENDIMFLLIRKVS